MSSTEPDTRTKILRATWDQLESEPSKMPRMSDIAKRARISRQALYLHFDSRTDLLVETTRYQDRINKVDEMLAPSRNAVTGRERLDAFVTAWANYIPRVWSVAQALLTLAATETEAKAALDQRMTDVREGFEAAVKALEKDGDLPPNLDTILATDLLSMLMSFRNWENLCIEHGWTQQCYTDAMRAMAQTLILGDTQAIANALECKDPLDPGSRHP